MVSLLFLELNRSEDSVQTVDEINNINLAWQIWLVKWTKFDRQPSTFYIGFQVTNCKLCISNATETHRLDSSLFIMSFLLSERS